MPSAKLSQFANLDNEYKNGDLNSANSAYVEGQSIPYRYFGADGVEGSILILNIQYQFQSGTDNAFDFLTNDDQTIPLTNAQRFGGAASSIPAGFGLAACDNQQTVAIPNEAANPPNDEGTDPDNFLVCGNFAFTFTVLSGPTVSGDDKLIKIKLTLGNDGDASPGEANADFAIFFAGHLALDGDWPGTDNGAGDISGAPFHMRAEGFNDLNNNGVKDVGGEATEHSIGAEDRSVQTGAIVAVVTTTTTTTTTTTFETATTTSTATSSTSTTSTITSRTVQTTTSTETTATSTTTTVTTDTTTVTTTTETTETTGTTTETTQTTVTKTTTTSVTTTTTVCAPSFVAQVKTQTTATITTTTSTTTTSTVTTGTSTEVTETISTSTTVIITETVGTVTTITVTTQTTIVETNTIIDTSTATTTATTSTTVTHTETVTTTSTVAETVTVTETIACATTTFETSLSTSSGPTTPTTFETTLTTPKPQGGDPAPVGGEILLVDRPGLLIPWLFLLILLAGLAVHTFVRSTRK